MIAYFALLSFVPLLFLALSLTALAGQQTESSYLVEELRRAFPASSVDRLLTVVRSIQDQATSIGIIGGIALLWGALGFFSVLESAFNIVYGLPNRSFVRQKLLVLALVASSLAVLFVALVVGSVGVDLIHNTGVAGGVLSYVYALAVSTALIFGLVWTLYNLLTNAALTWSETFPGAVFATVLLQVELPGPPRVCPPDERRPRHAAGLRRPCPPALLALPDGERARARSRGQLVVPLRARGDRGARDRGDGLVGREPLFERGHDLLLDLRLVLEEAAEGLAREHEEAERRGGGHRGGAARVVVDQGDLAEEVARRRAV